MTPNPRIGKLYKAKCDLSYFSNVEGVGHPAINELGFSHPDKGSILLYLGYKVQTSGYTNGWSNDSGQYGQHHQYFLFEEKIIVFLSVTRDEAFKVLKLVR